MNIEQIFEKPLKRNINGVVKAEQTDDASAGDAANLLI